MMKNPAMSPSRISAMKRLREIEFTSASDTIPAIVGIITFRAVKDAQGEIVDWLLSDANEYARHEIGLPLKSLVNKRATELFGDSSQVLPLIQTVRAIMTIGGSYCGETRFPWNGKRFILSFFPHGVDTLVVSAIDVTKHKKNGEDLRASEARFRVLAEAMSQIIWSMDASGVMDYYNQQAPEYAGINQVRNSGWDWANLVHPDDLEAMSADWQRALVTGETYMSEQRLRRADGEYRWHLTRGVAIRDDRGRIMRWIVTATDIHNQKLTEKALRDSQILLRAATNIAEQNQLILEAVIQQMPAGLIIKNASGELAKINKEMDRIWRRVMGPTENIGRHGYRAFHTDGREYLPDEWPLSRALMAGEAVKNEEMTILRGDGTTGTILASSAPIKDKDGKQLAGVVIDVDITENKLTENALQEKQKELTLVNEELQTQAKELYAAYQALSEADQHKNWFLAMLSHELRNPLASMQNGLQILDRTAPGGEEAKRAKTVLDRQFTQLTRLVDDLLDITRITQNKIQLRRERLELNELVRGVVEDHRTIFEKNGINLEAAYEETEIIVDADGTRLAQIVGNLLHNAAKYTGQGGEVRVAVTSDPIEKQARIHVIDSGEGISPEMLQRLFHPFMQAETAKDRSPGGLGLGLALSKGLVELHGGEINVHSAGVGKGSEFIVRLPLSEISLEIPQDAPVEMPHPSRRILVIEDNMDLAVSMRDLLELYGHEVAVAYDGSEGLIEARKFLPEVILCDIGLPGMDGYAVARVFRKDEAFKRVFLVALSGYAQPTDQQHALEAGFDLHLAKPLDISVLVRVLLCVPRGVPD